MIEKSPNFATYSRPLCWIVSVLSLLVAILTFTGDAENSTIRGLLWLGLAVAFAISAMMLSRGKADASADEPGAGE